MRDRKLSYGKNKINVILVDAIYLNVSVVKLVFSYIQIFCVFKVVVLKFYFGFLTE